MTTKIRTEEANTAIPSSSPAFGTPLHPINNNNNNNDNNNPRNHRRTGSANPPTTTITTAPPIRPATVLPVLLPPATLRPLAFRTFTKKHGLTLTAPALAQLASFVGRHCGSGWREDGLAEKVLDEVARMWKKGGGAVIVDGDAGGDGGGERLKGILRTLEGCMIGGRIAPGKGATGIGGGFSRQASFTFGNEGAVQGGEGGRNGGAGEISAGAPGPVKPAAFRPPPALGGRQDSFGLSGLDIGEEGDEGLKDPREWIKVVGGFEQPQLVYNTGRKHFERSSSKPSFFPSPAQKTELFRQRYHITYQRVLRNEAFQTSSFISKSSTSLQRNNSITSSHTSKITPIANLLGRSGTSHVLLGLLALSPTSTLVLSDLTGTIALDLQDARPVPEEGAWFCPGMIVLVDGVYDEDTSSTALAGGLGDKGGVGGNIGGKFVVITMGHPPCERRSTSTGAALDPANSAHLSLSSAAPFGWTDFLGVGSERATGSRMRKLQARLLRPELPLPDSSASQNPDPGYNNDTTTAISRGRVAIAAEVAADHPSTLPALRAMLHSYASGPQQSYPLAIVLMGNFLSMPAMTSVPGASSIDYKEAFDALAAVLAEFPTLLAHTTLLLVPGDNDGWAGAGSAGAAVPLPRKAVPDMFTTRIRRTLAEANRGGVNNTNNNSSSAEKSGIAGKEGELLSTSNPTRMSVFGCAGEIVLFRDDICGRLRRSAVPFTPPKPDDGEANGEGDALQDPAQQSSRNRQRSRHPSAAEPMEIEPSAPDQQQQQQQPQQAREEQNQKAMPPPPTPGTVDPDTVLSRRLVHTILSQSHLSPFPLHRRPVHWAFGAGLSLYPLPSALVLADAEAPPFALVYSGCTVVNPGPIVAGKGRAGWAEVDVGIGAGMRGKVCGAEF